MKLFKVLLFIVAFTNHCSEKQRPPSPPSDEEQHDIIYKRVMDLLDEIDGDDIQYNELDYTAVDYIKTMPQTPLPPTPVPERKKRVLNESSNNIQR